MKQTDYKQPDIGFNAEQLEFIKQLAEDRIDRNNWRGLMQHHGDTVRSKEIVEIISNQLEVVR